LYRIILCSAMFRMCILWLWYLTFVLFVCCFVFALCLFLYWFYFLLTIFMSDCCKTEIETYKMIYMCVCMYVCMYVWNVFSKWLEKETEHTVRCTKPSYKHMHSEVSSCPAKSCDVRMLRIQCSAVYRSAHGKACCMFVQVLSEHPHVLHTTQVPTQNMYIFSVFKSLLFALIPFCLTFHSTVYLHILCKFF